MRTGLSKGRGSRAVAATELTSVRVGLNAGGV